MEVDSTKELERLIFESFHEVCPNAKVEIAYVYGYTHIVTDIDSGEILNKISDLIFYKKTKNWPQRYDLSFYRGVSSKFIITLQPVFPPYKE